MFCVHCGKELTPGAKFCSQCGAAASGCCRPTDVRLAQRQSRLAAAVPKPLAARFPHVSPYVFVAVLVAIALCIVWIVVIASGRGYDLSGTYCTDCFFPVNTIVFREDGTFTAYNEYETLNGQYRKSGDGYSLRFTGGVAHGGNAVSDALAGSSDMLYELFAEKGGEGVLYVSVVPKIGYWAWDGKVVAFYRR